MRHVSGIQVKNSAAQSPSRFAFFRAGERRYQAGTQQPVLSVEQLYKNFRPGVPTINGVSFSIERGEFVFITGPSGAGKSTLLQLIYREQQPERGRILFCGKDVSRLKGSSIPFLRRNLGIVFQDFKLVPYWTVAENVAIALQILKMPERIIQSRVQIVLDRVGLGSRGNDLVAELSGGEQQRVAIARAVVAEPALIIADEPTGNLDPHLALDILTLLEEINESGITVLFATHDHSLIAQRSHRILILDSGHLIAPTPMSMAG